MDLRKILVVDDEPDVVDAIKRGLEARGFVVDAYTDPLLALKNYKSSEYEMALLDVKMPTMNGFQLYKELLKRNGDLKVRFFSAFEEYQTEFKKAFPELDKSRFIRKPMTLNKLNEILLSELRVS